MKSWVEQKGGGCIKDGIAKSLGNTWDSTDFKAKKCDDGNGGEGVNRPGRKKKSSVCCASFFIFHWNIKG